MIQHLLMSNFIFHLSAPRQKAFVDLPEYLVFGGSQYWAIIKSNNHLRITYYVYDSTRGSHFYTSG